MVLPAVLAGGYLAYSVGKAYGNWRFYRDYKKRYPHVHVKYWSRQPLYQDVGAMYGSVAGYALGRYNHRRRNY
uniref:Uncharacterized protein n=1 Tax=uncultured prokaryote TaxID=198431 RepID=A0A0H5Q8W2_9ZZZZ|nr:hypothetical protein [uncultured prokaryote]